MNPHVLPDSLARCSEGGLVLFDLLEIGLAALNLPILFFPFQTAVFFRFFRILVLARRFIYWTHVRSKCT